MSASAKVETPIGNDISQDKLIEILTPKNLNNNQQKRIPKDMYLVRKDFLTKKLTIILDILRTNYWHKLSEITAKISSKTTPILLLAKIRTESFTKVNTRQYELIYSYLMDMYIINHYLQILEQNVEDGIEYNEVEYDEY
ncbi:Hypothetical protein PACV_43 [Pacmanvirus A23]|uniref:Hypothetical protein n=1 Tax=Pacmanvirus A23 TaxID=1932881 RepID=UPI000A095035|nr:Hypothetical protein B9W72_gp043 [Pacmanvirus A23]SIP85760.1 Hypothetical protein PACV_43 [Pacmanvirus A23]